MRQWFPLLETLLGWALILLVASAGAFMARGLWLILEPAPSVSVSVDWNQGENAVAGERTGPESYARTIADGRWFGDPSAAPEESAPEPVPVVDAPETELQFVLRGVMAGTDPTVGSALIARSSGSSEYFRVGDAIFDQAELVEVYGNRVILSRGGELETLSFENDESSGGNNVDNLAANGGGDSQQLSAEVDASGQQPSSAAADASGAQGSAGGQTGGSASAGSSGSAQQRLEEDLRQAITEVQSRAQSDPQGLLRQYGLEATDNGYRVTSRAGILIANGLRPGDRITEINDQPVGDIDRDQALVDSVLQSDQIKITLERSGATYRFYQSLPNF